jgi:tRNA-2-methylthio-N6-dimethylallyladenosine synthase
MDADKPAAAQPGSFVKAALLRCYNGWRMRQGPRTFYIETFGCQMNVHDSEKVAGTLIARGYRQVDNPREADLVLYNTCSVRDKAEQKVFSRLSQFKRANGHGKVFGVLGCVAQQEGAAIFEKAPHVSLVVGSASYRRLPELLQRVEAGERGVTGLGMDTGETFETEFTRRDSPHRAFLTIMEGCDKHCAYCVVPFTRGRERSRTSAHILREAAELRDAGYTEIQLLGQNVNSYRDPSLAGMNFPELLAAVAEVPGIRRVRFMTSHPRDFTRQIVAAIDSHASLCDHVHLPVQSGSDRVLARMQREYTRAEYVERIAWLRSARRRVSITTDLIVGFPGETEADFAETLSLLDAVRYDSAFSFKYSPRPNTPALALNSAVPEAEKGRRLAVLQEKQREIQLARNQELVGSEQEVLIEGRREALGQWIGRTSQNRVLNFTVPEGMPDTIRPGCYAAVKVTRAGPNSLVGELSWRGTEV